MRLAPKQQHVPFPLSLLLWGGLQGGGTASPKQQLNFYLALLMVAYATMKSSFQGIRGQCWELTHDEAGTVYLEGLGNDYYQPAEVKRCEGDSILLPFVIDEMEAAWVQAFMDAVSYWQHYN